MKSNLAWWQKNFIQDLTKLYTDLGFIKKPDQLLKRLDFLFHEFISQWPQNLEIEQKLENLRHFFYMEKRFGVEQLITLESYVANYLTSSQVAAEFILSVLYKHLANKVNIPLEFVSLPNGLLLRLVNDRKTLFISAYDQGKVLSLEQMISRLSLSKGANLDAQNEINVFFDHLEFLKTVMMKAEDAERLMMLLNMQLEIKPNFTPALAQRASLYCARQENEKALCDFRRYFSFMEESLAPIELMQTYQIVQSRLDKKNHLLELQ